MCRWCSKDCFSERVMADWSRQAGSFEGQCDMPILLTEDQQHALDSTDTQPPQVVDPRTNAAYVLIPLTDYQAVRELVEDEKRQRAFRTVSHANTGRRLAEAS